MHEMRALSEAELVAATAEVVPQRDTLAGEHREYRVGQRGVGDQRRHGEQHGQRDGGPAHGRSSSRRPSGMDGAGTAARCPAPVPRSGIPE